jgi:hypothetical protein
MAFPGKLSVGARGRPVQQTQEWLIYHGLHLTVDGQFGPATRGALETFQRRSGIADSGSVDVTTWTRLTAPLARATSPIPSVGLDLRAMVCLYARQHLAQEPVEIGGPNDGPWVRSYMLGNGGKIWQWCAGFVCYVLAQACASKGVPLPFRPSFGVPELVHSAGAEHRFNPNGPPIPGDVFVIPTAKGGWSHTGFVLEVRGDRFLSAEGNTNQEGGSDGVCARSVLRNPARCDFLRVG